MNRTRTQKQILILANSFYPHPHAAAIRNEAFAEYLADDHCKVFVIADKKGKTLFALNAKYEVFWTKIYPKQFNPWLYFQYLYRLIKKVRQIVPDLIIISSPPIMISTYGLFLKRLLKIPFILDIRDLRIAHDLILSNPFLKVWLAKRLERKACAMASLIFTVCAPLKKQLVEIYRISEQKIKVISNGVDLRYYKNASKISKRVDIVYSGYLWPYQDPYRLFEGLSILVKNLPMATIQFIGGSIKDCFGLKLPKVLKDNVEFVPAIPYDRLSSSLSKCRVGLISISDFEPFRGAIGTKIYDYLGAGLPVVCLGGEGNYGLRGFITQNKIGYFTTTPKDFAEKIFYLLQSQETYQEMRRNSLKMAKMYDRGEIIKNAFKEYISPLLQHPTNE